MVEHPEMELYEIETPRDAYYAALRPARVADDGRLEFYRCNGVMGGTFKITGTDSVWEDKVRRLREMRN